MGTALLTVIVVEYHSRPEIDHLMDSLARHEPGTPVVISSNSLYDDAGRRDFDAAFPGATILHNDGNLGYAGGVNRALARVATPYAVILNPDVELVGPIGDAIAGEFARHPRLAVAGPCVTDETGNRSDSARRFLTPAIILTRMTGMIGNHAWLRRTNARYLLKDRDPRQFFHADWVSGGAMFVRMDAFRAVGGMDERYFLYMEDLDWCRTFWHHGWEVAYTPAISLIHRAHFDSTRRGLRGLLSRPTRSHLAGYVKYFRKWGVRTYSPADRKADLI